MDKVYIMYICLLYFSKCLGEYSPLVEIYQGKLRGVVKTDWKGGKFYSFLSIPYARKPIGKLRFMVPHPAEKWDGILDATEDMPECIQRNLFYKIVGQEDCLYVNVHTPEITTKDLKAVMVFIHGGGFTEGSGRYEMHGPEFLITEGVVVVTINYRVGLFGFLNFENPSVEVFGNMGLKDQSLALQWVQQNVEKFGGDPKSVTIFGHSAGGASVHFQMVSPMSKGLFHKAIAQSGTALHLALINGEVNTGVLAAKILGFNGRSESDMLSFLQEASTDSIFKIMENETTIPSIHKSYISGPIVETNSRVSFLPRRPEDLISERNYANVPFMLGSTDFEGLAVYTISLITSGKTGNAPLNHTIPYTLNVKDENTEKKILKNITDFYYHKGQSDVISKHNVIGDISLNWAVYRAALAHTNVFHENLYMYLFSADTELNYFKRLHPVTAKLAGAVHADELGYIFKSKHTPDVKPGSKEAESLERVVKLWTNFAKYGNPTPTGNEFGITWTPAKGTILNVMNISTDALEMQINPFMERLAFWDKLHDERHAKVDEHIEL